MATKHTIAQAKYDKENRKVYGFRLHKTLDADVIEKLASVPSMQGYIKQLIRDDIARTRPLREKIDKLSKDLNEYADKIMAERK